jgi:hypothetical protein
VPGSGQKAQGVTPSLPPLFKGRLGGFWHLENITTKGGASKISFRSGVHPETNLETVILRSPAYEGRRRIS